MILPLSFDHSWSWRSQGRGVKHCVKVCVMYSIIPHQIAPIVTSELLLYMFKYVCESVPVLIGCVGVIFPHTSSQCLPGSVS